jgi:hypothetical protein
MSQLHELDSDGTPRAQVARGSVVAEATSGAAAGAVAGVTAAGLSAASLGAAVAFPLLGALFGGFAVPFIAHAVGASRNHQTGGKIR